MFKRVSEKYFNWIIYLYADWIVDETRGCTHDARNINLDRYLFISVGNKFKNFFGVDLWYDSAVLDEPVSRRKMAH